ncbi:MAG: hypothetical protein QM776_00460 [Rhodocyclaceae bacterium]
MSERIELVAEDIRRYIFDLIVPIQTTKVINENAFISAIIAAREMAVLLKGLEMLPRKVLYDLDMAAGILENESEYSSSPEKLKEMAQDFRLTLGLILCGEIHADRQPGVPRVR